MTREVTTDEVLSAVSIAVYTLTVGFSVAYAVTEDVGPDDRDGRRIKSGVVIWQFLWAVIWPLRLLRAFAHFGKWLVSCSLDFLRFYLPERKVKVPQAKVVK